MIPDSGLFLATP